MRGIGISAHGNGISAGRNGSSCLLPLSFIGKSLPLPFSTMRQLKLTKTPTPVQQAEATEALRWLESLPVPAECPAELYAEYLVPNFRFILSLAAQYQNQGLSLMELVAASHAAAVARIIRHGERPEELADSWAWWVRQGMLGAVVVRRH